MNPPKHSDPPKITPFSKLQGFFKSLHPWQLGLAGVFLLAIILTAILATNHGGFQFAGISFMTSDATNCNPRINPSCRPSSTVVPGAGPSTAPKVRILESGPLNDYQRLFALTMEQYGREAEEHNAWMPAPSTKASSPISDLFINKAHAQVSSLPCQFHIGNGIFLVTDTEGGSSSDNINAIIENFNNIYGENSDFSDGMYFSHGALKHALRTNPNATFFTQNIPCLVQQNGLRSDLDPYVAKNGIIFCIADSCAHEYVHRSFDVNPVFNKFSKSVWTALNNTERAEFVEFMKEVGYSDEHFKFQYSILTEFVAFFIGTVGLDENLQHAQALLGSMSTATIHEDSSTIVYSTKFGYIKFDKQTRGFSILITDKNGKEIKSVSFTFDQALNKLRAIYALPTSIIRVASDLLLINVQDNKAIALNAAGEWKKYSVTVKPGTTIHAYIILPGASFLLPQGGMVLEFDGWVVIMDDKGVMLKAQPPDGLYVGLPPGTTLNLNAFDPKRGSGCISTTLSNGDRYSGCPNASGVLEYNRNNATGQLTITIYSKDRDANGKLKANFIIDDKGIIIPGNPFARTVFDASWDSGYQAGVFRTPYGLINSPYPINLDGGGGGKPRNDCDDPDRFKSEQAHEAICGKR